MMDERIFYLDFLKGVSILFVVLLHVASQGLSIVPIDSFAFDIYNVADSICRFTVPVFVMISGVLMLNPDKDFKFWKSLKRLTIPLFLWSFFYAIVVIGFQTRSFNFESIKAVLKLTFITPTHNWFMFMLIGLYLIIPILRPIVKSSHCLIWYMISLWTILSVICPFLEKMNFLLPLCDFVHNFSITMPLGFVGYFLLGYVLNKIPPHNKSAVSLLIALFILSVSIVIFGTKYLSSKNGNFTDILYDYHSPFVVISAICVFLLGKFSLNNNYKNKAIKKIITLMSKYSLAIYMLHVPILIVVMKIGFTPSVECPVTWTLCTTVAIYLISFMTIHVLSTVSFFRKYMM